MSTVASNTIFTPKDLLDMPDEGAGYELVDGQLVEETVSEQSSRVAMRIGHLLQIETDKTRDARVYGSDLGYQCFPEDPNRVRKGDVSLIRTDRLKDIKPDTGFMPIPADLIVEVISPNDIAYAVMRKIEQYLKAGFRMIWTVYPETQIVLAYRTDGAPSWLRSTDEITGESALPNFRCRVSDFFQS